MGKGGVFRYGGQTWELSGTSPSAPVKDPNDPNKILVPGRQGAKADWFTSRSTAAIEDKMLAVFQNEAQLYYARMAFSCAPGVDSGFWCVRPLLKPPLTRSARQHVVDSDVHN